MIYHITIALNSVGKRKVGNFIFYAEYHGLELCEIRKKVTHPTNVKYPDLQLLMLKAKLEELEEIKFFKEKFSPDVLQRKIAHFCGNHVELFFESGENFINPHIIWDEISRNVFYQSSKTPLFFVTTSSGENGFIDSFIPNPLEINNSSKLNLQTLRPLETK